MRLLVLVPCVVLLACSPKDASAPAQDASVDAPAPPDVADAAPSPADAEEEAAVVGELTHEAGCSWSDWCWVQPAPQGNVLNAGFSFGPDDAWFVGEAGSVVHWDGAKATAIATPAHSDEVFHGVWGPAPNDVWIVGGSTEGVIRRFDGTRWTSVIIDSATFGSPTFSSIWGSSANDVWLGSYEGPLLHWNGTSVVAADPILGAEKESWPLVWGTSANDVWAAGAHANLAHFDGTTWSLRGDWPSSKVVRIDGSAADDAWLLEFGGNVRHYDGSTWKLVATVSGAQDLQVVAKDDVWVGAPDGLMHWEGGTFVRKTYRGPDRSYGRVRLAKDHPSGLWFITGQGRVERYRDKDLGAIAAADDDPNVAMSATSKSDAWIASGHAARHWDGTSWSRVDVMPTDWAVGVYASTPNDVFMVGSGGTIARWDGAKWTTVKTSSTWASITGTSANDVWIGGAGIASHWDGSSWTDRTMDGNVDALTSTSADDVHAAVTVAGEAKILRFDGTAWTLAGTLPAGTQVRRLWAAAKDDVWATTTKGVLRWTGGPWSNVLPAATASRGVFGTGPADVWIVQDRGIIEHWNGASWFGVDAGTTAYLFDGFATHDDVWVVGSGNAILHHTR